MSQHLTSAEIAMQNQVPAYEAYEDPEIVSGMPDPADYENLGSVPELSLIDPGFDPNKPETCNLYKSYINQGLQSLMNAIAVEQEHGLEIASPHYDSARIKYLGALSSRPFTQEEHEAVTVEDLNAADSTDPRLRLLYSYCLAKLVESGMVAPYSYEIPGEGTNARLEAFREIASTNLDRAKAEIEDGKSSAEVKIKFDIVTADGLRAIDEVSEAVTVADHVDTLIEEMGQTNTSSNVIRLFRQSNEDHLETAADLTSTALYELGQVIEAMAA